jgi:hypothetical protein
MERPYSIELLHPDKVQRVGSSIELIDHNVYLIGGHDVNIDPNPYLHLASFDINKNGWNELLMNSFVEYNRSFHASLVVNKEIYIIGGRVETANKSSISNRIVKISNSIFGVQTKEVLVDDNSARQGLTVSAVGMSGNTGILYGGYTLSFEDVTNEDDTVTSKPVVTYPTTVLQFQVAPSDVASDSNQPQMLCELKPIELDGTAPCGRAYHSSTIAGVNNEFILVFGGKTETGSLCNDLYILNLYNMLVPEVKGKGSWSKLTETLCSNVSPRQLHQAFITANESGNKYIIFGGVSENGGSYSDMFETTFANDTITNDLQFREFTNNTGVSESLYSFGLSSILLKGAQANSSCILTFGGSKDYLNQQKGLNSNGSSNPGSLMIVLDNNSDVVTITRRATKARAAALAELLALQQGKSEVEANVLQLFDKLNYPNGDVYEGENIEDSNENKLKHGNGKMVYCNGDVYDGEWCNDMQHGLGVLTSGTTTYKGSFHNNLKQGQGELSGDGFSYTGEFADDIYNGKGVLVDQHIHYEGNFQNGLKHGEGIITDTNTSTSIRATFKEDKMLFGSTDAMTLHTLCDGFYNITSDLVQGTYSGTVYDSIPCRNGKIEYIDGSVYEGTFKSGKKNGYGLLTYGTSGDCYEGKFVGDRKQGKGKYVSGDKKTSYDGEWLEDLPSGFGKMAYADGSSYDGFFVKGAKCGSGTYVDIASGYTYTGEFYNNLKHGKGVLSYTDGKIVKGTFEFDEFVQE